MSRIQPLPQTILADITPYLCTDEKIEQALLQDNKKPNIIWLISTNQAIILHGQQPEQKPAIMVMALDDIKEIDYLQKDDDIQVVLYSGINKNKAVFHFEPSAKDEVEKFFLAFGDLITYRLKSPEGKINVIQRALPIGDKERHLFGRGKKKEAVKKSYPSTQQPSSQKNENPKDSQNSLNNKIEPDKADLKTDEKNSQTISPSSSHQKDSQKSLNEKRESDQEGEKTEDKNYKTDSQLSSQKKDNQKPVNDKSNQQNTKATHLGKESSNSEQKPENSKEIDYGNPLFFLGVTVIATLLGFFCLAFFKQISRIVKFFKKN